jgi:radical SAM superfamily enzyme YgiQ (UPF0313 family)
MNNPSRDVILIHPPDILNKGKYAIFPVPWNLSHFGSTSYVGRYPVGPSRIDMPLGFFTMANFIRNNSDYTVDILNLASLKLSISKRLFERFKDSHLKDRSILRDLAGTMYPSKVVSTIKKLKTDLFAVDLHWLNFSQGAIQILKLLKQIHPHSYTLVGGLTASYFKDEIMNSFPFIDFLISGDGCVPLLKLIGQIKSKQDFSKIPNLIYREKGIVGKGPSRFLNDFNYVQNDDKMPPPIPTARGCLLRCITCGGSKYSSKNISNYTKFNVYSVESIMKKLFSLTSVLKENPHHLLVHDPFFTMGKAKWEILLDEIKKNKLNTRFSIEFFTPHSKGDILKIARSIPGSWVHISPESIDVNVRSFQKNLRYANKELVMNMDTINDTDNLSMQIWFMAGLAKDTNQSVDETLSFIKCYYKKLRHPERNIIKYNELLFIDPGSLAFDYSAQYGYRVINKSFLYHMNNFVLPIFKYQINYETEYFTRNRLFSLFLYIHNAMNKIYYEYKIIDQRCYDRATLYNNLLDKYAPEYDRALLIKNYLSRSKNFERIGNLFRKELGE